VSALAALVAAVTLTGGLQGVVTRGPTTPVCRVGVPCTAPAPNAGLIFIFGFRRWTTATDARGRYRIALPPGTYRVLLASPPPVGGGLRPERVLVPGGRFATRNFTYDTGIR
jgi:hypothetical protein